MIDKKKAAPPQNSQLNTSINKINYSKKAVVIKQFKSHMSEYRDCILGTYDCADGAVDYVLKLISELQLANEPTDFKRVGNCFSSNDYVFNVYTAAEAIGFSGQAGYFSISRRSACNVFLRLLCWVPVTQSPLVFQCCKEISRAKTDVDIVELLAQLAKCQRCDLTVAELVGQFVYEQAKLDKIGFDELVLLTTLERLLLLGVQFDLLAALQHASLLSDGFFYSYCDSVGVQYE